MAIRAPHLRPNILPRLNNRGFVPLHSLRKSGILARIEIESQFHIESSTLLGDPLMRVNTLADLCDHQSVRITAVHPGRVCENRLADLGFLPGTLVSRVGQAPFGDPVVYSIRGTRFALRRNDAQQIAVEPIESSGQPAAGVAH